MERLFPGGITGMNTRALAIAVIILLVIVVAVVPTLAARGTAGEHFGSTRMGPGARNTGAGFPVGHRFLSGFPARRPADRPPGGESLEGFWGPEHSVLEDRLSGPDHLIDVAFGDPDSIYDEFRPRGDRARSTTA